MHPSEHLRLARECEKLDISAEQEMADFGLDENLESWTKYFKSYLET